MSNLNVGIGVFSPARERHDVVDVEVKRIDVLSADSTNTIIQLKNHEWMYWLDKGLALDSSALRGIREPTLALDLQCPLLLSPPLLGISRSPDLQSLPISLSDLGTQGACPADLVVALAIISVPLGRFSDISLAIPLIIDSTVDLAAGPTLAPMTLGGPIELAERLLLAARPTGEGVGTQRHENLGRSGIRSLRARAPRFPC